MQINEKTEYCQFAAVEKYVSDKGRQKIQKAACAYYGDYWDMSVGEFIGITKNEIPQRLGKIMPTVYQWYWLDGLRAFADTLAASLKRLTPPQTPKEMAASGACMKITMEEGLLFFARSYFGLKSFAEAERVTLADLIMAKKESYNSVVFSRALAATKK